MDNTAQWPQGIGVVKVPMEGSRAIIDHQRRPRPQKEQVLNCPRCNSTNTKFCYYNNYSLTQPRYFCKTCRRYWTEGGSLRNVPVGGGSRKHKRSTPSSSDSSKKLPHDLTLPTFSPNPKLIHEGQDLNLTYPSSAIDNYKNTHSSTTTTTPHISAMELLKTGIASSGLSPFLTNSIYSSSGFGLQDQFKQSLNFSLDGGFDQIGYGIGSLQGGVQESSTNAKLFFPFEELKQPQSTADQFEQNRGQGGESSGGGYWSGMLGTGGSW